MPAAIILFYLYVSFIKSRVGPSVGRSGRAGPICRLYGMLHSDDDGNAGMVEEKRPRHLMKSIKTILEALYEAALFLRRLCSTFNTTLTRTNDRIGRWRWQQRRRRRTAVQSSRRHTPSAAAAAAVV